MKNVLGNIPVKRTHSKTGRYSHTEWIMRAGTQVSGESVKCTVYRLFNQMGESNPDKFLTSLSILAKKKIVSLLYNC